MTGIIPFNTMGNNNNAHQENMNLGNRSSKSNRKEEWVEELFGPENPSNKKGSTTKKTKVKEVSKKQPERKGKK